MFPSDLSTFDYHLCIVYRLSLTGISSMTVSLGMHTVWNEDLETENDAQVTRRVSRVTIHNEYNRATDVNNKSVFLINQGFKKKINFIQSFFFKINSAETN